ncbi:MAG TPA: glycosyltransferase [Tepidisphaeraceae bacterium]|jgi:glycosyltransferase involved in cell wall biosynthesis|nr:glycosyltransferase [Tepidisphaeraceae bacterium]
MRILADTDYALRLRDHCKVLDEAILERYGRRGHSLARRWAFLRGWFAVRIARDYDLIVTCPSWPGGKWIVIFQALFGKKPRRIMLLEFGTRPKTGLKGILYPIWLKWIFAPAIRRAVRAAQVMTAWEGPYHAKLLNVPEDRFRYIPWPLSDGRESPPASDGVTQKKVMSSGRAVCDWETLFEAAAGTDWSLTIVCGRADLSRVRQLGRRNGATVLCDIPVSEHQQHIESSAVYVLCLRDEPTSCGQVRLMNAISAGVPVVATRVRGLEGYAIDGTTATLVDPGDHEAIRRAVNRLLENPAERRALSEKAFNFAKSRSVQNYNEAIATAVAEIAAEVAK